MVLSTSAVPVTQKHDNQRCESASLLLPVTFMNTQVLQVQVLTVTGLLIRTVARYLHIRYVSERKHITESRLLKICIAKSISPSFCMFHIIYTEKFLETHTSDTRTASRLVSASADTHMVMKHCAT